MIYCFAHRINNILKLAFYQSSQRKIVKASTTTPIKQQLKEVQKVCDSSSDNSSSEDDTVTPSPSKFVEANTFLSDLSPKSKEVLSTISTSKKLVRYIKKVSKPANISERLFSLWIKLSLI